MLTQNQKSLKQAWHDLFWRDCVFCLYISRMFYLFLKFWSLAGFSLNMDDSSLFPSSYHHHQNLFSLFILYICYRFDHSFKSSFSGFFLRYTNYSWAETSALAFPSAIFPPVIVSLFPHRLWFSYCFRLLGCQFSSPWIPL